MMRGAQPWVAAQLWRASRRAVSNRELLYGGATGLRFLTFFYAVLSGQLGARRRIANDPLRSFECHQ